MQLDAGSHTWPIIMNPFQEQYAQVAQVKPRGGGKQEKKCVSHSGQLKIEKQ